MAGRNQAYGFKSATTVQPANGGHAYLFGNGSENDLSEEDGEGSELRPRGRERLRRGPSRDRMDDVIYLVKDIKEGDTLNSISLQYFCSVSLSRPFFVGTGIRMTPEPLFIPSRLHLACVCGGL